MDAPRSIVVTGMGVVSPLGVGVEDFHNALAEGRDGITTLDFPWETGYQVNRAGCVRDFHLRDYAPDAPSMGRTSQFALAAAALALEHAGLECRNPRDPQRCGLVVGTALGDALEFESNWLHAHGASAPAGDGSSDGRLRLGSIVDRLCDYFGFEAPSHLVATTCAAGNHAIAWCSDALKLGDADCMLAVCADTIGFVDMLGFSRLLLQAPERCRPFDKRRKGTILSEGGGAIVLETRDAAHRRGARILAEVAGYGLSSDAAGPFASKVSDTRGLRVAAERALRAARMNPDEIQHVSAHGSGTKLNDHKETLFLKQVLGPHAYRVPVSGIKSMVGHGQGAAALFEAIASVMSIQKSVVYPTMHYENPDPNCDLDYVPNAAREMSVDTVLSNAFGVGGNNAVVIFRRWGG